jgi:hypothetical protein
MAAVRRVLIAAAESAAESAAELAERPDCPRALRRAEILAAVLRDLGELTLGAVVGEALLEAEYARGVADCKAARCHLEVLDGGLPGPR